MVFKTLTDLQLVKVSALNTTTNTGKLDIGNSDDEDIYLKEKGFGVSYTVSEFGQIDFAGLQFPHIPSGTVVKITITDHASHMAGATVLLTFTEG